MAISVTALASGGVNLPGSGSETSTLLTAVNITAGDLICLIIHANLWTAPNGRPSAVGGVTGLSLTERVFTAAIDTYSNVSVWTGVAGSTVTGAQVNVTIPSGGWDGYVYTLLRISGAKTTGTNGADAIRQSATAITGNPLTVTLPGAMSSGNRAIVCGGSYQNNSTPETATADYSTELFDGGTSLPDTGSYSMNLAAYLSADHTDNAGTITFSGGAANYGGIVFEIDAAPVGTTEDVTTSDSFSTPAATKSVAVVVGTNVTNSFAIADSQSVSLSAVSGTVSEAFAASDSSSAVTSFPGSITESFSTPSDANSVGVVVAGSTSDSFAITDSQSLAAASTDGSVASSFAVNDTQSSAVVIGVDTTESFAVADSVSYTLSENLTTSETFSVTESSSASVSFPGSVSESFASADSQSGAVADISGSTSDTFAVTDSQSGITDGVDTLNVSEQFSVSDSMSAAVTALALSTSDSFSASDSESGLGALPGSVTNSFAVSDTQSVAASTSVGTLDSFSATFAPSAAVGSVSASVAEQFIVADSVSVTASGTINVTVSETFSVTDLQYVSADTEGVVDVSTVEQFSMASTASVTATVSVNVSEACAFSDTQSTTVFVGVSTSDSFSSTDVVSGSIGPLGLSLTETVALQSTMAAAIAALSASVSESFGVSDSASGNEYDGIPEELSVFETFTVVDSVSLGYQSSQAVTLTARVRDVSLELIATVKEL